MSNSSMGSTNPEIFPVLDRVSPGGNVPLPSGIYYSSVVFALKSASMACN